MADKVSIAKKDIYADVEVQPGTEVRQLIARKGQQVPDALVHLVSDGDVTSEQPKTRSLLGRSTTQRRAAGEAARVEPTHEEARAAAAAVPGPEETGSSAGAEEPVEAKAERKADGDKARRSSRDKARRKSSSSKS